MIKATSQSVCSGITGCQVELLGSGAELIKEYKGVTAAMYRSLRGHMPEELAKEVLISITKTVLINRNDLSDNERCYRYLKDKIAMNEQKFDAENKVEQWGILEEGRAIIYNQAFKDLCKNGGFSDKAFLSWADRKGLIETQGGRMTKVKKVGGNPVRCVFLKLNENLDEDGFESVETMEMYEQEELPFK